MQIKATSRKGIRLFQSITQDSEFKSASSTLSKGRNAELIERRNKCLLCRFYFYAKEKKLRYEDIIDLLSSEFFLSQRTVTTIITTASNKPGYSYADLKDKLKELQSQFNFINWKN